MFVINTQKGFEIRGKVWYNLYNPKNKIGDVKMNGFLILAFLFSAGSLAGWGLEVLFRRFFSAKRWINPGFLAGPCLPLYGFSLCLLYLMAGLESLLPIETDWLRKGLLFLIMSLCITAVEYVAGLIFIKHMNIKLWDYSNEWGNINGIVCPLFSFFWAVLGAVYYFGIHPHIVDALRWLADNLAFSFCIGFFYGIFVIDFVYSTNLAAKIRGFAAEKNIVMKYEEFKEHIRDFKRERHEKAQFLMSMHSSAPISRHLKEYYEKHRDEYGRIAEKLKKKK